MNMNSILFHFINQYLLLKIPLLFRIFNRRALDMDDIKRHVTYASGYHPSQPYIEEFWDIVENMDVEEQG
jgi:hypothetical protein